MSRMVFESKSAPEAANCRLNSPLVISSGISTLFCKIMSPVSQPSAIYIVVTPVTSSPAIIARSIGAAPLYFGSKDAWTLIHPLGGMFKITLGIRRP